MTAKRGRIGRPIPGVSVRVVDPDTFLPLGPGEEGELIVRGPNVLKGYLGRPDLTAQAIRDGWYRTGDIARVEEDGFVVITDRRSRFSKIAGEMVPHIRVEEAIMQVLKLDEDDLRVAVTATAGGGSVSNLQLSGSYPNLVYATIKAGPEAGRNTFRFAFANLTPVTYNVDVTKPAGN